MVNVLNDILKKNLKNNILLGFGKNVPSNPIFKYGWGQPVFEDSFQGTSLDLTKWRINPGWSNSYPIYTPFHPENIKKLGIPPREYYDKDAIIVNNGLKLVTTNMVPPIHFPQFIDYDGTVYNNNGNGWLIDYQTGWIESKDFKQKYGYFEIRCKIANSKGMWPAFWLAGGITWPPEIDIFEMFPTKSFNQFESNYHWGIEGDPNFPHKEDVDVHDINNTSTEYNIYACEWDECFIKWYYNNMLVRVVHQNVNYVNIDFVVIVSTGVDPFNGNYRTDGMYPNSFDVDYVRVYKR